MTLSARTVLWRAGMAGLGVALLLLAVLPPALAVGAEMSLANGAWDGTSRMAPDLGMRSGLFGPDDGERSRGNGGDSGRVHVAYGSLADTDLPPNGSLVVLGPTKDFDDDEQRAVRAFVEAGGLLVLADDLGTGDQLLRRMELNVTIRAEPLRDLAFDRRPAFAVVTDFSNGSTLTRGLGTAILNHAAVLWPRQTTGDFVPGPNRAVRDAVPGTAVLANTSLVSWLDLDGDDQPELGEPGGPFAWMAEIPVGEEGGSVLVLSDPSVLLNSMRDVADNGRLAERLAAHVRARPGPIVVDEAHREGVRDPLLAAHGALSGVGPTASLAAAVVVFGLALSPSLPKVRSTWRSVRRGLGRRVTGETRPAGKEPAGERGRNGRTALVEGAMARHPGWDRERLGGIVADWPGSVEGMDEADEGDGGDGDDADGADDTDDPTDATDTTDEITIHQEED